jgi:hypothetical protein
MQHPSTRRNSGSKQHQQPGRGRDIACGRRFIGDQGKAV